eukprot:7063775-Pyramimonas_sp.AAC.1
MAAYPQQGGFPQPGFPQPGFGQQVPQQQGFGQQQPQQQPGSWGASPSQTGFGGQPVRRITYPRPLVDELQEQSAKIITYAHMIHVIIFSELGNCSDTV